MNNFKKTPVQTFTKGSLVTSEEGKYWKQLGVSQYLIEPILITKFSHFRTKW